MDLLCRQCEQTAKGTGCTGKNVCGKSEEVLIYHHLLIKGLESIAVYASRAGKSDPEIDNFVINGLFAVVTNVNFDADRLIDLIKQSGKIKEKAKKLLSGNNTAIPSHFADTINWQPSDYPAKLLEQYKDIDLFKTVNPDLKSLKELLLYSMEGMSAYVHHAAVFGNTNPEVNAFFHEGLSAVADETKTTEDLLGLIMKLGKLNLTAMEMLDKGHVDTLGIPFPAKVSLGVRKGPAIVISGHDLLDLKQLLEQTQDKGINIYTHGEMLPAHAYPELRKHKHLAGNFGTAWQNQQKEFDGFPGALLFTTNCIQKPKDSYKDRVFTTGPVAFPGIPHIHDAPIKDFSKLINKALELGGFKEDIAGKNITVGFMHNAILGVADKVIDAFKTNALKHIFLVGGCDGAKPGRNYYTEFAEKTPKDTIMLTLACGKYRFNRGDFGTLGGLPRLLDVGQCNDAYSAIKVATALAEAFKVSVNELPLSIVLSWYEQKAVAILVTLLSLGIKNIRIGPSLPAFITPNILKFLVDNFNIKPITTAEKDIRDILKLEEPALA